MLSVDSPLAKLYLRVKKNLIAALSCWQGPAASKGSPWDEILDFGGLDLTAEEMAQLVRARAAAYGPEFAAMSEALILEARILSFAKKRGARANAVESRATASGLPEREPPAIKEFAVLAQPKAPAFQQADAGEATNEGESDTAPSGPPVGPPAAAAEPKISGAQGSDVGAPPDTSEKRMPTGPRPKRGRGRPRKSDPAADRRIYEAWQTREHKRYEDLANELGMETVHVSLAIGRYRKWLKRRTN